MRRFPPEEKRMRFKGIQFIFGFYQKKKKNSMIKISAKGCIRKSHLIGLCEKNRDDAWVWW